MSKRPLDDAAAAEGLEKVKRSKLEGFGEQEISVDSSRFAYLKPFLESTDDGALPGSAAARCSEHRCQACSQCSNRWSSSLVKCSGLSRVTARHRLCSYAWQSKMDAQSRRWHVLLKQVCPQCTWRMSAVWQQSPHRTT